MKYGTTVATSAVTCLMVEPPNSYGTVLVLVCLLLFLLFKAVGRVLLSNGDK